MNSKNPTRPLDFKRDLDASVMRELETLTLMARKRLEERNISIAELKVAWLAGKPVPRPPLMIPDYPPRLIGADMYDYFADTVTHYKSYCAFLARFGQDNVSMFTPSWEYDFVVQMGGKLSEIRDKVPETATHPIRGPEDMDRLPDVDFDVLVAPDAALIRFTHEQLGDLIGPGIYVTLDPFSQVCSLLRKPELLMTDVIDSPEFVHRMCQFMTDVEKQVLRRLLPMAPLIVFSPGYTLMLSPTQFDTFALPYFEQLLKEFPAVPWLMGSGGKATHLLESIMKSKVPIAFVDSATDLSRAAALAKEHRKPITVLFPRSVLMRGDRNEIRTVTRQLLSAVKDIRFLWWTDAILGGDVPNPSIDLFIEAYRDYACYPLEAHLAESEAPAPGPAADKRIEIPIADIVWDADGEKALKAAVPFMFRKQARSEVEKMVAKKGIRHITAEVFEQAKKEAGF